MKFEFVKEQIKQVKEEIKSRKQWKNALIHEYTLERTFKNNRQNIVIKDIETANIMIQHYENVKVELEKMLKDLEKVG